MRTPIIAANWKMNFTVDEAEEFVSSIRDSLDAVTNVESVICPPYIAIPAVSALLTGTRVSTGAQNMHYEASGAYTGELSPHMLAPYCDYVILGHSERRAYFAETDEGVNRKAHAALANDLIPIICVGESLEQNEAGETESFVSGQVQAALKDLSAEQVASLVIAYEPIWAIGTGKAATAESANEIIRASVRAVVGRQFGDNAAEAIRIQYGGSTNADNIKEYMSQPDIDGALVGGASLKPGFVDMVVRTSELYG